MPNPHPKVAHPATQRPAAAPSRQGNLASFARHPIGIGSTGETVYAACLYPVSEDLSAPAFVASLRAGIDRMVPHPRHALGEPVSKANQAHEADALTAPAAARGGGYSHPHSTRMNSKSATPTPTALIIWRSASASRCSSGDSS